ncbi:MAG: capsular polysaccharide biosynthesis protein [Myxococcota bacterium]
MGGGVTASHRFDLVAVPTWGMRTNPHLAVLAGVRRTVWWPFEPVVAGDIDAVMVWGRKPGGRAAAQLARRRGLPTVYVEDGFVRSIGLGVDGARPLSLVFDEEGIYYDASRPSQLERWLAEDETLDEPETVARAEAAMRRIVAADLSKYNHAPPRAVDLGPKERPRVLVVDQTVGDQSVRGGLASETSFSAMLEAARDENPDAEIIVKTHPDVLTGKKRGYLEASGDRPGVRRFARPVAPYGLLAQVDRVYCVTSQLGFEARLANLPVTCFGAPWYAGWSQTDDRVPVPGRGRSRSLAALFAAAYLKYARYLDPISGTPGTLEDVLTHLERQRRAFTQNRGRHYCFGFRPWKHAYMRAYLRCPGNEVHFPRSVAEAERNLGPAAEEEARFVVWGQREPEALRDLAERRGIDVCRVEDGFLRSVGLGSDLAMPASLVFDRRGIYYDPRGVSDLEHILETATFDEEERRRARALRERIVAAGLSKYNVGAADRTLPVPVGKYVLLVPGQVEDDASVRLGGGAVKTNFALVASARRARPDAYVIFKPHPDVLAGNRRGHVDPTRLAGVCDHVETEATLAQCLAVASEVHTMTSLVGFEALLRGIRVVTYGLPFYAGWGLTDDHAPPCPRRTRRLDLDALVAGALLRYPRYLDRDRMFFVSPEITIDQLLAERAASGPGRVDGSWWRRQARKARFAALGLKGRDAS